MDDPTPAPALDLDSNWTNPQNQVDPRRNALSANDPVI